MSKFRDWAGLPDGLLHSIVELLGSLPDLLAFAATYHPWRSAFSSYPSKSTLYTLFPHLFLNPEVPLCSPRPFPNVAGNTSVAKRPCYVIDLGSQDTLLCSQIPLLSIDYENNIPLPPNASDKFVFGGASFGQMIFSRDKISFLFDVFTGIEVSLPLLPDDENTKIICGAALTGPLASPDSHLIVITLSSCLSWRVGSDSWSKCSPRNGTLDEFVVFKGQVYGMGSDRSLFMVHLTPQIHFQEIPVCWSGRYSITSWHLSDTWLVVCGDMLLMVGCHCQGEFPRITRDFGVYRLDTSTEPAKWLKVERLENWAIFISCDRRVQPLSCLNPERWGGRSSCVYCYDYGFGHLVAFELGKALPEDDTFMFTCVCNMLQPTWIVPSMLSLCCDGQ